MSRKFAAKKFRLRTHTRFCTIRQRCNFAPFVYDQRVSESLPEMAENLVETTPAPGRGRWQYLVWPQWLPVRARLPLLAQLAGVAALMAAVAMPNLSDESVAAAVPQSASEAPAVIEPAPQEPVRPAHLNLDVRHNFKNVNVTVTIDDQPALETTLNGSGKRFGVFGKREDRVYAKTFDLEPGVRVVRVRVRSAADKYDQTRVERFELGSASVASLRLVVEKSGLTVFADRPPVVQAAARPAPTPQPRLAAATASAVPATRSVMVEIYQTLRSLLIAMAGFVATTAAGFVVQEFLISRKRLIGL